MVKVLNTILAVVSFNSQSDNGMSGYSLLFGKKTKNILAFHSIPSTEEVQSFRIPAQLPDIVKCRSCGQFGTNTKGLKRHQTRHRSSVVPPLAGQLPPTTSPTPLPPELVPPDIFEEIDSVSTEELMDLFQRPLYDIQRAWRAPLFRIVQRLSQGILPMLSSWMSSPMLLPRGMWELASSQIYVTRCSRNKCGHRCGSCLA